MHCDGQKGQFMTDFLFHVIIKSKLFKVKNLADGKYFKLCFVNFKSIRLTSDNSYLESWIYAKMIEYIYDLWEGHILHKPFDSNIQAT